VQSARSCGPLAIFARLRWCLLVTSKLERCLRFQRMTVVFSTDTPSEENHVYRLDRGGSIERVGDLSSSSIYACKVGEAMFFSTMIEPSSVNKTREVQIAGSTEGTNWHVLAGWQKDSLPPRYFQYGNAIFPDGVNATRYLAATTIAVERDDLVTTLWEVESV